MSDAATVHHAVARIDLHLPDADSLKDKRSVVQRALTRLRDDLGCSAAEVGAQDRWRRAVLGVAVVASSNTGVERVLQRLTAVLERDPRLEVIGLHDEIGTLELEGPGLSHLSHLLPDEE